jgi:hypothetical protein
VKVPSTQGQRAEGPRWSGFRPRWTIIDGAGKAADIKTRVEDALHATRAASVAGLLLTTEVMIAEAPKDEHDHAHPAPGGMGDMGM